MEPSELGKPTDCVESTSLRSLSLHSPPWFHSSHPCGSAPVGYLNLFCCSALSSTLWHLLPRGAVPKALISPLRAWQPLYRAIDLIFSLSLCWQLRGLATLRFWQLGDGGGVVSSCDSPEGCPSGGPVGAVDRAMAPDSGGMLVH